MTNQKDGLLWSFLRDTMIRGTHISADTREKTYEEFSARLDVAALDQVARLTDLLEKMAPSSEPNEQRKHGWKRVEDGLPPERPYPVLVTDGVYLAEAWHQKGIFTCTVGDSLFSNVSHWKPTPPLPPDEDEANELRTNE